jgi:hypothetical protein
LRHPKNASSCSVKFQGYEKRDEEFEGMREEKGDERFK